MAKFREKTIGTKTENFEGAKAFSQSPKWELVSMMLTSFVQDSFYESAQEQLDRLSNVVSALKDKRFAGKTAIFARQEYGLRSITHALIGELVKNVKNEKWTKFAVEKTVRRPDDMLEMIGYYLSKYGKPIPNSLKKGLRLAIKKFDTYQLAKYRGDRSSVKMVDLFNLVKPKPTTEMTEAFKKLMEGNLKSKGTWESKITKAGQTASKIEDKEEREKELARLKKESWAELIKTKKIGYFALLRNLRNILKDSPEVMDEALTMLVDEKLIKKSLVMPFRFYSAYKEIKSTASTKTAKVLDALSTALDISCKNIPDLGGTTMVAVDNSMSMTGNPISPRSKINRAEIACLLGAMMFQKTDDTLTSVFADSLVITNLMKSNSVLANIEILRKASAGAGGSTNGWKVPEYCRKNKIMVDNFLIFCDLQMYDAEGVTYSRTPPDRGRSFKKEIELYRKEVNPNAKVYSFDCAGYGTLQLPANDPRSYLIPGFSEKMFDVIKLLDSDRNALISKIEEIEL